MRNCTVCIVKTKAQINCAITAQWIYAFVFVYADCWFSHAAAQFFQPLRPFIITKDHIQKTVYGLGYPSIPTMTIEEFFDKKVEEGTLHEHG